MVPWALLAGTTGSNTTRRVVLETRKDNIWRAAAGPGRLYASDTAREAKQLL